jgi:hypothetical protein
MGYRAPKGHNHQIQKIWRAWLASNAMALKQISLPSELTATRDHWIDFLQNGHLHWHPESNAGFGLNQMSREQMSGLLALLEASTEFSGQPIVGYLRHRLALARDERPAKL